MMQQEFEKLTKVKVTSEEYNVIEAAYMACQEDKQVFCKQWLKKDGIRNLLKDRLAEIKSLNSTIKELEKKSIPSRTGNHPSSTAPIIPTLPIAVFPPPVNETEKTCSQCSQTLRFSLPPASASTPQNLSSSRM